MPWIWPNAPYNNELYNSKSSQFSNQSQSNRMPLFWERGKLEYQEKNLSDTLVEYERSNHCFNPAPQQQMWSSHAQATVGPHNHSLNPVSFRYKQAWSWQIVYLNGTLFHKGIQHEETRGSEIPLGARMFHRRDTNNFPNSCLGKRLCCFLHLKI